MASSSQEGVFERPRPASVNSHQGELVDRLMAKIAELEAKLYARDLAGGGDLIRAVHGVCVCGGLADELLCFDRAHCDCFVPLKRAGRTLLAPLSLRPLQGATRTPPTRP